MRIAILKLKSKNEGIELTDEIIEYLAANFKNSVRELEGAIISLIAQSSFNKKEITIELAKQIVAEVLDRGLRIVSRGSCALPKLVLGL